MRKIIIAVSVLLLISGCATQPKDTGNMAPSSEKGELLEVSTDESFLSDFKLALQARWDNNDDYELGTPEHKNMCEKIVSIERECLDKYLYADFEDRNLKGCAERYINNLLSQEYAASFILSDYDCYNELWREAQLERAKVIRQIVTDYGVEFDTEYSFQVNTLCNMAYNSEHSDEVFDMLNEERLNGNQNIISSETGSVYTTYATNKMDYLYRDLQIDLYVFDNNGEVVDWIYTMVDKWEPGETIELSFELECAATDYVSGFLLVN